MFAVRSILLLALWSAGAFLPIAGLGNPARAWQLAATVQPAAVRGSSPSYHSLPDRALPGSPLIDRFRRRLAEQGSAVERLSGTVLDVRYVDQVYAQGRLECSSGRACVWNDCGPASAAMVLHYEGLEPRDVLYNRQATLGLACEAKPNCRGTTNRNRMLATLQNHGLDAYVVDAPSLAAIRQSIDRGHPVILSLTPWPDHVMVAVGYRPGDIVVVHDPYGGAFWWRHMDRVNEPRSNQPKRNGEGVEYAYSDLKPLVIYGLFTTGPASKASPPVSGPQMAQ